ncbi:aldo/keto reductase [Anaerolineales bacterium HSG24]|nr:aldo/keto reductase [Anaerolineales bacterium HSG24]
MDYKQLGQTNLQVSRLCLGTMTMGWTSDKAESFAVMDYAYEHGLNFFDTADIYSMWVDGNDGGVSETWIGEWLTERNLQNKIIIATKARGRMWEGPDGEGLSRNHLMRAVEDSLRRLQIETIDLYQSHWPDDKTPLGETFRAFEDMIKEGKVRYIGCSNHSTTQLQETLDLSANKPTGKPRYESLQPHYNLVHRAEYETDLMALCEKHGLGVIPYSPLAGGFLTGKYRRDNQSPTGSRGYGNDRMQKYLNDKGWAIIDALTELSQTHNCAIPQTALAWLLANPTITSVIVGANRVEQLADSINAVDLVLSEDEKARLDNLPSPT